jgi:RsiW-degrading membrane proteinase PrsW (M82 family)
MSLFAGEVMAFSYGLTSIIRGIGSIPGHAMWTACSGYAIGHILEQRRQPNRIPDVKQWNLVNPLNPTYSHTDIGFHTQQSFFSKSSSLQLPTSLPVMLGIAMFGHAFWNGSSVLVSYISGNLDPLAGLLVELTWIVVLISLLWVLGRFVLLAAMEGDA